MVMMIVILGIAFATLPMMLSLSSRSVENSVDLKGLYHGVAKMQVVSGKIWDEANVDSLAVWGGYNALQTTESDASAEPLWCGSDENNRSGHYTGLYRRKCSPGLAASAIGADGGDRDDIDDFDTETDGSFQGGYVALTSVAYISSKVDDADNVIAFSSSENAATTTNLKRIGVTMSKNGRQLVRYYYYAANIGMPKPYIREMQP